MENKSFEPSIKDAGFTHQKLLNYIEKNGDRESIKIGDMFYNPLIKHLFVVVQTFTLNDIVYYKTVMVTSKNHNNLLVESRFIEGYFARVVTAMSQQDLMKTSRYIGSYDNTPHLIKVRRWLKQFKL